MKYGVTLKTEGRNSDDMGELGENKSEDECLEKYWVFQESLPKEKSPYRISLG
ncbi:hypothetical protein [Xenorhabdus sp. TH1]|uniref:hypothetical protein n=1 Tax=Xenorhabdus sp. TH1 TaxID=3130166 RepID=UPI0030D5BA88